MKKRSELCKNYRELVRLDRVKMENRLNKLEKDLLLSFKNERNLNESIAVSAIKSNLKLFYAYAKNNAKVKA